MITSEAQVTVRYAETDMMGVVYHANYLPWLEIGRTTLLREHGLPYRMLEELGYRLPVLEISAKYLRPAVYDDTLTIVTTMREKPLIKLVLDYEVRRGGAGEMGHNPCENAASARIFAVNCSRRHGASTRLLTRKAAPSARRRSLSKK